MHTRFQGSFLLVADRERENPENERECQTRSLVGTLALKKIKWWSLLQA